MPTGSGGAVRVSVTGRTSIVGSGPTRTRPGAVPAVVDAGVDADVGGTEGVGVPRGAVDGGSGTKTSVVLVVRAMVVGAAVVGAAVVGAAVVVGATLIVGATLMGAAVMGTIGGAAVNVWGVNGMNGIVPVGRPGVVADVGTDVVADVVAGGIVGGGEVDDEGATEKPGAAITRPSGGTTRGRTFGACVVAGALSDRDFLAGRVPGTAVVVVGRGALVDRASAGPGGMGTVRVTTKPSGGTTGIVSDSRNSGSGRARGTVAVEA